MRLIDADELKRSISQNNKIPRIFQQVINAQPTAYSVDGVVKELEERADFLKDCTKYGNKNARQQEKSYGTMMMYEVADLVDDLIEIVKQDSVSDDLCEWNCDEYGVWHTECYELVDSDPLEYIYCPYCGKKMKVVE